MRAVLILFPDQNDVDGGQLDPLAYLLNELQADDISSTLYEVEQHQALDFIAKPGVVVPR